MRRLVLLGVAAALFAAVPATHEAMANGNKAPRIDVCHNTEVIGEAVRPCILPCPFGFRRGLQPVDVSEGQVITVNGNAVAAHVAHGDRAAPFFRANEEGDCRFDTPTGPCRPLGPCPPRPPLPF